MTRMYRSLPSALGHQLMALATGADTHKMKYGHRGGNHPVKDLSDRNVSISPHRTMAMWWMINKLDSSIATPAFVNVNDGTNEGLKYIRKEHLYGTVPSGSVSGTTG